MLATFNEILFKMPSASSVKFHVEIQLEECLRKFVLYLPVFVICGTHLRGKRNFSSVKGDLQVSRSISALTMKAFSSLNLQRLSCLCLCLHWELRQSSLHLYTLTHFKT